eukprot:scaffold2764_cov399-Prasinococcus_capsulatus_cf.AAC.13
MRDEDRTTACVWHIASRRGAAPVGRGPAARRVQIERRRVHDSVVAFRGVAPGRFCGPSAAPGGSVGRPVAGGMLREGGQSTSIVSGGRRKVHTSWPDGSEMVEEYDAKTDLLLCACPKRRMLGKTCGVPRQAATPLTRIWFGMACSEKTEGEVSHVSHLPRGGEAKRGSDANLRVNLRFRIRNLPYPESTYGVTIDHADGKIVVRTNNKKYYKRLEIPELAKMGKKLEEAALSWSYANNTLVIGVGWPLRECVLGGLPGCDGACVMCCVCVSTVQEAGGYCAARAGGSTQAEEHEEGGPRGGGGGCGVPATIGRRLLRNASFIYW